MSEKPQPERVLYCAVCSLPAEYCEFGADFEACKPWILQNAPELYPDLVRGDQSFFFLDKQYPGELSVILIQEKYRFSLFLCLIAEANKKNVDKVSNKLESVGISSSRNNAKLTAEASSGDISGFFYIYFSHSMKSKNE